MFMFAHTNIAETGRPLNDLCYRVACSSKGCTW